jgi:hypothetical protein
MTGRAQMWDGAEWISMTGGIEIPEGGTDPDDTYLRLDGANNPAAPNNWLRKADADILYLGISSPAVSAAKWTTARTITLAGDASGSVTIDGSANKTLTVTVLDNSHSHSAYSPTSHSHPYLPLSGGALTGKVTTNNSGGNVTHEEAIRSVMIKPVSVGGATPAPQAGNGTILLKYDG